MLLGVIADDFTGASDVALALAREGMRTRLYIGAQGDPGDCEAGVVALKSRSTPASEAVALSLSALAWLQAQGCRQTVFKYCSTFDSTPRGNIGPVAEALAEALGVCGVVVCPALPAAGRTVYQGHLFVGDRLLSESGMERHPLTPMTDPDIRRWLGRQVRGEVGHVGIAAVKAGRERLRETLARETATLVVADAIAEDDLRALGSALADHPLVTGGSGIVMGLPDNFRAAGRLEARGSAYAPQRGPGVVLSGSCSNATRGQIAAYRALGRPSLAIDVAALIAGAPVLADALEFIDRHRAAEPLLFSSADPQAVLDLQARSGTERAAEAVERLFGALAVQAVERGFRRIVIAGGETSGAVVSALGLAALDIGPEIAPGVPAVSSRDEPSLALALKSGNFGGPGFMAEALRALGDNA
jgi:3-dehydrotetronate 4-kinase